MKKLINKISILMITNLLCFLINNSSINNKDVNSSNYIRTIQIDKVNIDYEEVLSTFDNNNLETNNNITSFTGSKEVYDFTKIDNTALDNKNKTYVDFTFKYDSNSSLILIKAKYIKNNEEMIDELYGYTFTDEENNIDAIIYLDEEETILLSELKSNSLIENCGWLSKAIKNAISLVTAAIIVSVLPVTIPAIVVAATINVGINVYEKAQAYINYKHNKQLSEPTSYINGQGYYKEWKYGTNTMDYNGCGVIAMYNVLLGLNKRKNLKDIAYDFDRNSGTIVSGLFGSDPTHFSTYFLQNRINYKRYSSYESLQEGIKNMKNNQMILVCAETGPNFFSGVHNVAARYNKGEEKPVEVFNLYIKKSTPDNFRLFDDKVVGGKLLTSYIVG